MKKRLKILVLALLLVISIFAIGDFVMAADGDIAGLDYGAETGLSQTDPRVAVTRVIRIMLGFLGILAVGLIIYGGWMYMTSEGNEERVEKAKNILKTAVIGLVIILSAFGIASFIISRLLGATGVGGDGCIDGDSRSCGCMGTQVCSNGSWGPCVGSSCGSQGGIDFYIRSTNPGDEDDNIIRNIKISAFLNRSLAESIDQDILDNNVLVEKIGDVDEATGNITPISESINGSVSTAMDDSIINFTTDSDCEILGQTINNCLPAWSQFKVTINANVDLIDMNGQELNNGEIYEFVFSTNNDVDMGPPIAGIIPTQICQDDDTIKIDSNIISGWGRDDRGLNYLAFYQKASSGEFYDLEYFELANGDEYYFTKHKYDTSQMIVGSYYDFKVEAEDIAGDYGEAVFTTDIKPGHCCNGIKDIDEEEIDCGGADCLSCAGGPCNVAEPNQCGEGDANCSDSLCSTFFCECKPEDSCICERKPIIDWVSPEGGFCNDDLNQPCNIDSDCSSGTCNSGTPNANYGNIITIGGRNFGNTAGKVYFGDIEASFPKAVNINCDNNWTDTEITVLVPNGISTSAIKVEATNGYIDATDDNYGSLISDFEITSFDRPGLCLLSPNSGEQDDRINYYGLGLLDSSAFFGNKQNNIIGLNQDFTNNLNGSSLVPNIEDGRTSSFVKIKINNIDVESNYKDFIKTPSTRGPQIFSFNPVEGNVGQYVTIKGRGFGDNQGVGEVYFGDTEANYEFPEVCSDSLWSDDQIIVKVPDVNNGNYLIKIKLSDTLTINTSLLTPSIFEASSDIDLKPGICKIEPDFGLPGSDVTLWGEYFGAQDTNSKVRFSNQKDQVGNPPNIFWDIENMGAGIDPYRVDTTVHSEAITGLVRIVKDSPEVVGNSVDFEVGYCYEASDPDGVCGDSRVCCPEDSFRGGECRDGLGDCYFEIKNSVYEFEFKTGINCPIGSESCGTSCCSVSAGGCENSTISKCATCTPEQNLCDDGNCCSAGCELDLIIGSTICPITPESCSGYGYDQCIDSLTCPNSPGNCSPYGTADDGGCDCCCTIGQDGDCCEGLNCTGTCGSDMTDDGAGFGSCSGCVEIIDGVVDQNASDLACTCLGTVGKFCDTTVDVDGDGVITTVDGVCKDCTQLANLTADKCMEHAGTCCIDAENGNICKGGYGEEISDDENSPDYGYCAYYNCGDECENPDKNGSYNKKTSCISACAGSPGGASCYDEIAQACTATCVNPYNCMGETGCQSTSCDAGDESCKCCCSVPDAGNPDPCQAVGLEGLNCREAEPCSENKRGLCCGCFADSECVPSDEPTNVGCSSDSCCRPRPTIESTYPSDEDNQVCRNAEIGAWFDRTMDVASFAGNMVVLGDYGSGECPSGTQYLVMGDQVYKQKNVFARAYLNIKRSIQKVIAFILIPIAGDNAYAFIEPVLENTYCAVPGTIIGVDSADISKTKIVFKPSILLDANRKYYAVIKGDEELDSSFGVKSSWKVAMAGNFTESFNGIEFKNAHIWEFTTLPDQGGINNGVCQVDKVEIYPASYLFQTTENDLNENDIDIDNGSFDSINDSDKLFTASAVSHTDQLLIPIDGYYSWTWSWSIGNTDVANFVSGVNNLEANEKLIEAQAGIMDDSTITTAEVFLSGSYFNELLSANPNLSDTKRGEADIWVFICDNPWPAPSTDGWLPWQDSNDNCITGVEGCLNANYQLYYCRDAGEFGTADDLPVVQSGVTRGKSDTSLKESYFFRANLPVSPDLSTSVLEGTVNPAGKEISLDWSDNIEAKKYKIYYGQNSRAYTNEIEISDSDPTKTPSSDYTIDNLENGVDYYFTVTALYENGAESNYSNEISLRPWDSQGPVEPQDISAVPGDEKVTINWKDVSNGDTDKFSVQYKCDVTVCDSNTVFATQPVEVDSPASTLTVSGISNDLECCFGLIAYDQYGNKSATVTVSAMPISVE